MTNRQPLKFGEICQEVKLSTKDPLADGYERYIGLEHLDSGSLEIKRWGMIKEDNPSFSRVFKKGHILFGKRRPYLKKAALAEFDGVCSSDIIVIKTEELDILKVILSMADFWQFAVKNSSGSLSPRTKFSSLKNYEISTDKNLYILSKIVSQSESINKKYADLVNGLEVLSSVLCRKSFTLSLGELNGLRSPFSQIAKGWQVKEIGDVFKVYSGGTPSREITEYWGGGVPWVKTGEINYSYITTADEFITKEGLENSSAKIAYKGSILLAMYGQGITRGRVGLVGEDVAINQACLCIYNESEILCKYLYYYLKHNYMDLREFGNETTQKNLSGSIVKKIKVVFPPLEKVSDIVRTMEELDAFETNLMNKMKMKENLIASIISL